jgi:Ca2+-binding RTX toxin-like protein
MKNVRSGLLITALLLSLMPAANAGTEQCFGREPTIVGTEGEDELDGTPGSDVIVGLGGPDRIYGLEGKDFICAGSGEKEVPDEDMGGTYTVGDYVHGGKGHDEVDGGPARDALYGAAGNDWLNGGEGAAVLLGRGGDDTLIGADGIDDFDGDKGADEIQAGDGADRIDSGRGNDTIDAGPGDDDIVPLQGDDLIDGGEGRDLLNLFWEACSDSCLSSHRRQLVVDLAGGFALGMGDDTLVGIEDVWGGSGDDSISGDDGPNLLGSTDDQGEGVGDENVLSGRGGDDTLLTSPGKDWVFGGSGTDTLTFALNDGPANINLATGIVRSDSRDRVSGVENARAGGGDNVFIGDEGPNVFWGNYGNDEAWGGGGDDTFYGRELGDELHGEAGEDQLFGGRGGDELFGGDDDDTLDGGPGTNDNDGGAGFDTCSNPFPLEGAQSCEA